MPEDFLMLGTLTLRNQPSSCEEPLITLRNDPIESNHCSGQWPQVGPQVTSNTRQEVTPLTPSASLLTPTAIGARDAVLEFLTHKMVPKLKLFQAREGLQCISQSSKQNPGLFLQALRAQILESNCLWPSCVNLETILCAPNSTKWGQLIVF